MIPETFEFIGELTQRAHDRRIEVLVEIHSHYLEQIEIAKQVDWVYDFALPPLVLHTLYTHNSCHLKRWLEMSPRNAITVLDTHDGIGVIDVGTHRKSPDGPPGLLSPKEIAGLVETIHQRSNGESRQATGPAASNLDLYQVNCTFYDALGRRDDDYLIARAIQFFAPGVPQIYYVGLLAGSNDMDLLRRTGVGRDINRHYYTQAELHERLKAPVVRSLLDLIRFRNAHPAFGGEFQIHNSDHSSLVMEWRKRAHWARLDVDLAAGHAVILHSDRSGRHKKMLVAPATVGADR
jgi:sucrose phosphorylase